MPCLASKFVSFSFDISQNVGENQRQHSIATFYRLLRSIDACHVRRNIVPKEALRVDRIDNMRNDNHDSMLGKAVIESTFKQELTDKSVADAEAELELLEDYDAHHQPKEERDDTTTTTKKQKFETYSDLSS